MPNYFYHKNNGATMLASKAITLSAILLFSFSTKLYALQVTAPYIDNQWPDSRYTDNGNETVTDNETGLMWKKCSEGLSSSDCATGTATEYTWKAALELADTAVFASYDDWRIPNMKELGTLVARDRYNPSINETAFPNTANSNYWTSTPYANNVTDAWIQNFYKGTGGSLGRSSINLKIRLVRGGN